MRLADRHHQESLAPLLVGRKLRVRPKDSGHQAPGDLGFFQTIHVSGKIINVGNGPAIKVSAELYFNDCPPELPADFFMLAPNEEMLLNGAPFHILVPPGTSMFQPRELPDLVDAAPWRLVISYQTPFGAMRKTTYEHAEYHLVYSESIGAVPINQRRDIAVTEE